MDAFLPLFQHAKGLQQSEPCALHAYEKIEWLQGAMCHLQSHISTLFLLKGTYAKKNDANHK
jgi:hypothetical protein